MTAYSFEMVDETDIVIEGSEDGLGLVLNIDDDTLQSDVSEYLVPKVSNKMAAKTRLTINIQLESVNTRKTKQLLVILGSVLEYFDTENVFVIWFCEATDETAYEMGLKIQGLTKINFSFQVY